MVCKRCEVLPEKFDGRRDFYFWAPLGHSSGKIRQLIGAAEVEHRHDRDSDGQMVTTDAAGFERLARIMEDGLTAEEMKAVRSLMTPAGAGPQATDFPGVASLRQMIGTLRSDWLIDVVNDQQFEVSFMPITHADNTEDVWAHEARLRAPHPNGQMLSGSEIFQSLRDSMLLFQVDRAARLAAIRCMKEGRINTPILINFSPSAIYDPVFCLRSTVAAIKEAGLPSDAITFTIVCPEYPEYPEHLKGILDYYRTSGFRVALGRIGTGFTSFELLQYLRPDVILLDRSVVSGLTADPYKEVICRKMLEVAQRLRIETIMSGIASEDELRWSYEHGANFVQGPAVAAARAVQPVRNAA